MLLTHWGKIYAEEIKYAIIRICFQNIYLYIFFFRSGSCHGFIPEGQVETEVNMSCGNDSLVW